MVYRAFDVHRREAVSAEHKKSKFTKLVIFQSILKNLHSRSYLFSSNMLLVDKTLGAPLIEVSNKIIRISTC